MSKSNHDLNGLNWQENADGSWCAVTKNYKCVAMPKLPEEISTDSLAAYTYEAMLYKWNAAEDIWMQIDRTLFGARGAQDAMLDAEQMLGRELLKVEREADPEKRLLDDLRRRLEEEQYLRHHENEQRQSPWYIPPRK